MGDADKMEDMDFGGDYGEEDRDKVSYIEPPPRMDQPKKERSDRTISRQVREQELMKEIEVNQPRGWGLSLKKPRKTEKYKEAVLKAYETTLASAIKKL